MQVEQLFRQVADGKLPATLLIQGEDPYFVREWKKYLHKAKIEVTEVDLKKKPPSDSLRDETSAISLFNPKMLLWVRNPAPPTHWRTDSKAAWKSLMAAADSETNIVALQVPLDKRTKWDVLNCEATVRFAADPAKKMFWLAHMNHQRGNFLSREKMEFLAVVEDDYLLLDNFVELWSLGGDFWATRSLGWGAASYDDRPPNTAFAWVDAVVVGDKKNAAKYLQTLLVNESQEPLQLMGLLTKSVRILAALEHSWDLSNQPPFLIDKLRGKKGRALKLLELCSQIDVELKSSSIDKFATMLRL